LNNKNWDAMLGLSLTFFEKKDYDNAQKYFAQASEIEPKLKNGPDGISELEKEGYVYSDYDKEVLNQLFKSLK